MRRRNNPLDTSSSLPSVVGGTPYAEAGYEFADPAGARVDRDKDPRGCAPKGPCGGISGLVVFLLVVILFLATLAVVLRTDAVPALSRIKGLRELRQVLLRLFPSR